MSKLLIIRGPLGVGKSTVARAVATALAGQYVSIDQIMEEHGLDQAEEGGGISVNNFLRSNDIVRRIMADAPGTTIVVDGNFYHKEVLDDLVDRADGNAHVFTLKASVETCIRRDEDRPRSYGEDATRAVHAMVSAFDAGTIIPTDERSQEEVTVAILEAVSTV